MPNWAARCPVSPGVACALLDVLFQKYLLCQVSGDPAAVPDLIQEVRQWLST